MCHLCSLHWLTSLQIIGEVKAWLVTPSPVFEQPHFSTLSLGQGPRQRFKGWINTVDSCCCLWARHLTLRPHPDQQVFLTDDQYYLDVIVVSGSWPELQHPIKFHTVGPQTGARSLMGLKSTDTFFTRHHCQPGAFLSISGDLCWVELLSSLWHCCF